MLEFKMLPFDPGYYFVCKINRDFDPNDDSMALKDAKQELFDDLFDKMFVDKTKRDVFITKIANMIASGNEAEPFMWFHAETKGGKSCLTRLLDNAFGKFVRTGASNCKLSQDLRSRGWRRFAFGTRLVIQPYFPTDRRRIRDVEIEKVRSCSGYAYIIMHDNLYDAETKVENQDHVICSDRSGYLYSDPIMRGLPSYVEYDENLHYDCDDNLRDKLVTREDLANACVVIMCEYLKRERNNNNGN
jgi:hypothetical protein